MGTVSGILGVAVRIATILAQAAIGFIVGFVMLAMARGPWAVSIILFGAGLVVGSVGIGWLAIALRKSVISKRYIVRASGAIVGAFAPLIALVVIGLRFGSGSSIVEDRWGPILSVLAPITTVAGFYLAGLLSGAPRRATGRSQIRTSG